MMSVWVLSREEEVAGVFSTREAALIKAGGEIDSRAGRQPAVGGIGWTLPDGRPAWREDEDGSLCTYDATIAQWEVTE